jgi:hypothetical protein
LGFIFNEFLINSEIHEQKLSKNVEEHVRHELQQGKTPSQIYRSIVRKADNPLNTSIIPSKQQIYYQSHKVRLEKLPSDQVFIVKNNFNNLGNWKYMWSLWRYHLSSSTLGKL